MLNQTTITAFQALVYLQLNDRGAPIAPGEVAAALGASPAYLAKINTQLVKAGVLRAHRGTKGGVTLARSPADTTLLEVVEACQGRMLGDYCQPYDDVSAVCGFHAAMHELQGCIISTLERWTLADLARKPLPDKELRSKVNCRMAPASNKPPH